MVPLLNMRAEVRNTGDTGNFTEMAVPHLCTLMGQKNGTRTASSTVKTDRLLNGLTDQKNGTRTVNITAKVAPHSLTWTGLNAGTGTGNFTGKMVQQLTSTDASTGTKTGNDTVRTGPLLNGRTMSKSGGWTAGKLRKVPCKLILGKKESPNCC